MNSRRRHRKHRRQSGREDLLRNTTQAFDLSQPSADGPVRRMRRRIAFTSAPSHPHRTIRTIRTLAPSLVLLCCSLA
jgi:hypothetical protein